MTTVLITGASGFIARSLAPVLKNAPPAPRLQGEPGSPQDWGVRGAPVLKAAGMRVVGTSRRTRAVPGFDAIYPASLGDSLRPVLETEHIDAVVHAALDSGPNAYETNVVGTTRWLEETEAAGVPLQILLSTLSADAAALSDYGRAKHVLEGRFFERNQVVFRMAIVVGDGGMFARLRESARRSPVVPMLGGGRQPTYVLGIGFVCDVIRDAIVTNGDGLRGRGWNLQQPQAFTLREVVAAICRGYGFRRLLLPVPIRPILALVIAVERLPFPKLPISSTNLRGLIQAEGQSYLSDFERFGYPAEGLDALIGRVVRPQRGS